VVLMLRSPENPVCLSKETPPIAGILARGSRAVTGGVACGPRQS
jgi:hypothetical protein